MNVYEKWLKSVSEVDELLRIDRVRKILYGAEEETYGQNLDYNDVRILLAAYDRLKGDK